MGLPVCCCLAASMQWYPVAVEAALDPAVPHKVSPEPSSPGMLLLIAWDASVETPPTGWSQTFGCDGMTGCGHGNGSVGGLLYSAKGAGTLKVSMQASCAPPVACYHGTSRLLCAHPSQHASLWLCPTATACIPANTCMQAACMHLSCHRRQKALKAGPLSTTRGCGPCTPIGVREPAAAAAAGGCR